MNLLVPRRQHPGERRVQRDEEVRAGERQAVLTPVRARIELDEVSQLRADQRRAPADDARRRDLYGKRRLGRRVLGAVPHHARAHAAGGPEHARFQARDRAPAVARDLREVLAPRASLLDGGRI